MRLLAPNKETPMSRATEQVTIYSNRRLEMKHNGEELKAKKISEGKEGARLYSRNRPYNWQLCQGNRPNLCSGYFPNLSGYS